MHKTISRNSRHNRSQYDLQRDFRNIKNALSDTSYDVSGRIAEILADSANEIKDKSTDAKDFAGDLISDKPLSSVGVAALTGLVVGSLITGLSVFFSMKK